MFWTRFARNAVGKACKAKRAPPVTTFNVLKQDLTHRDDQELVKLVKKEEQ